MSVTNARFPAMPRQHRYGRRRGIPKIRFHDIVTMNSAFHDCWSVRLTISRREGRNGRAIVNR